MGYMVDTLDEIPEELLQKELWRREGCRMRHVCDYCEKPFEEPTCKFPERHTLKLNGLRLKSGRYPFGE